MQPKHEMFFRCSISVDSSLFECATSIYTGQGVLGVTSQHPSTSLSMSQDVSSAADANRAPGLILLLALPLTFLQPGAQDCSFYVASNVFGNFCA